MKTIGLILGFGSLIAICSFLILGAYVLIREKLQPKKARYSERAQRPERDYPD